MFFGVFPSPHRGTEVGLYNIIITNNNVDGELYTIIVWKTSVEK